MGKYSVYVDITFSTCVDVDADSREDAMQYAESVVNDDYLYYANWGTYIGASATDCDEN